jgi:hypothetical protein
MRKLELRYRMLLNKQKQENDLPSAYQRVDYIESTGTQYIDTRYIPNPTITIKCKVSFRDGTAFGAQGDNAVNTLAVADSINAVYIRYFASSGIPLPGVEFKGKIYELEITPTYTIATTTDGSTAKCGYVAVGESPQYSLFLFARNLSGAASGYSSRRMYYFKIYEGNTIIRNFIPCYRKEDDIAGLYDLVNGVFYTNNGTGNFNIGEEI